MSPEIRVPSTRATILAAGFKGLYTIEALHHGGQTASVPDAPGIFAVFRLAFELPRFATTNTAGRWKGEDPTLPVAALTAAWEPEAALLYVSKGASLRTRVRMFVDFGHGKQVAHWTGRAIWQLADADDLLVAWRPVDDPKAAEAELLAAYEATYGGLPWANRFDKPAKG